MSSQSDRAYRAQQRRLTATLHRGKVGGIEPDPVPLDGSDAISLVERLTLESWAAAGKVMPKYSREQIPIAFVPRHPK